MDESSPLLNSGQPHANQEVKEGISKIFLLATMTGTFLAMADESFVLSNSEEIGGQFRQSSFGPWILCSYNLGYCVALPLYGYLCNTCGHKPILLAALTTFAFGSLITGVAVSMPMLIAARVIAGVGGSGLVDVVSIMINDLLPISEVAVLRGYLSFVSMVGVCSGSPLGGLLMDSIGWRWSFAGQVPIILVILLITALQCPRTSGCNSRQGEFRQLDVLGLSFMTAAIGSLVILLQIIQQSRMKDNLWVAALFVVFLLSTVSLVFTEVFYAKDPLIPIREIKRNGSGVLCLLQTVIMFAQFALIANLATFFVRIRQVNNSTAGLVLLPLALAVALGSVGAGHIIKKYIFTSFFAVILAKASYTIAGLLWRQSPSYLGLIPASLGSLGVGSLVAAQFVAISVRTPSEHANSSITTYWLAQQLGMILGVAVAALLSQRVLADALQSLLKGLPNSSEIIKTVLNDNRALPSLPKPVQGLVRTAYLDSFQSVLILAVSGTALGLLIVIFMREYPIDT
ncbi:major facilitator superfamily domain-containing protein [Aspergillus alliaceus]|uniref:major facilitator superfamily domain-containing protein n=1 Tax=Petromyces alliaceus TaxID=209559 RepID=UPI0012A3F235|nr:major facilitator superfamily domain-containing protein [Aspergillus alliaceus]KAB8227339.1 major facilitator superfamily domain-containing protein [Aspergillus alliaceus]